MSEFFPIRFFRDKDGNPSYITIPESSGKIQVLHLSNNSSYETPFKVIDQTKAEVKRIDYEGGGYYIGQVVNGMRNGIGKLYSHGELVYDCEWKNDKPNGQGKFYDGGVLRYEGGFKDGKMDGKGRYLSENGQWMNIITKDGQMVENSATAARGSVVRSEELADNWQNYIGKLITVDLLYNGSLNGNLSLRCGEYESTERARSATTGFYEENEIYYTRVIDSMNGILSTDPV